MSNIRYIMTEEMVEQLATKIAEKMKTIVTNCSNNSEKDPLSDEDRESPAPGLQKRLTAAALVSKINTALKKKDISQLIIAGANVKIKK